MWMPGIVLAVVMMCPEGARGSAREPVASSSVTITEQGDFLQVEFAEGAVLDDFVDASKPYLVVPSSMVSKPVTDEPWDRVIPYVMVEQGSLGSVRVGLEGERRVPRADFLWFFGNLVKSVGASAEWSGPGPWSYLFVSADSTLDPRSCLPSIAPRIVVSDLSAYANDGGVLIHTRLTLRFADQRRTMRLLRCMAKQTRIAGVRKWRELVMTGDAPEVVRLAVIAKALDVWDWSRGLLRRAVLLWK